MHTIQEMSTETCAIKDFLSQAPDGAIVPYSDIEKHTGVIMDYKGKQKMRSAMRSLRREYACISGHGIEIESPENAINLVTHRLIKVDNAVKRGEKTSNRMTKFLPSMNEDHKRQLLHVVSVFGAIKASAQLARQEYKRQRQGIQKISN